ncbi:low molecular weight protein-tyrosine-phosphatase [Oceanomicrobium pacificus]|uniref:low molecular weight protein-tyrosine-phosphatase n=1 Tax=Oceanomicrobium pacificus TaxID=2692916 RepID=UPI002E282D2D|nr:low molecular weight protein-tyrosine-phosphatase [Oceanomicrobium pacificus]
MTVSVLCVCLGNICRSPTAEAVLRTRAEEAGLALEVDSAGTGGWHVGHPPDRRAQAAAAARGYDLSRQRARQVVQGDGRFDLILAMDDQNAADLRRLLPPEAHDRIALFLDGAPETAGRSVPDPYYDDRFDHVLDLIEAAADGWVARLKAGR